jgi:hypothetical protein
VTNSQPAAGQEPHPTATASTPVDAQSRRLALGDGVEVVLYPAERLLSLGPSLTAAGDSDPLHGQGLLLVRAAGHPVPDGFLELDELHLTCGAARWDLELVAEVSWDSPAEAGSAFLLVPEIDTVTDAVGEDEQMQLRGGRGQPLGALPSTWRDALRAPRDGL